MNIFITNLKPFLLVLAAIAIGLAGIMLALLLIADRCHADTLARQESVEEVVNREFITNCEYIDHVRITETEVWRKAITPIPYGGPMYWPGEHRGYAGLWDPCYNPAVIVKSETCFQRIGTNPTGGYGSGQSLEGVTFYTLTNITDRYDHVDACGLGCDRHTTVPEPAGLGFLGVALLAISRGRRLRTKDKQYR